MLAPQVPMKSQSNSTASISWHKISKLNWLIILLPNCQNQMVINFLLLELKLESQLDWWNHIALKSILLQKNNISQFYKLCLLSNKMLNIASTKKGILGKIILSPRDPILIANIQLLRFLSSDNMLKKIPTMILFFSKMLLCILISIFWSNWWGSDMRFWFPWLFQENWFIKDCLSSYLASNKISFMCFIIKQYMKEFSI